MLDDVSNTVAVQPVAVVIAEDMLESLVLLLQIAHAAEHCAHPDTAFAVLEGVVDDVIRELRGGCLVLVVFDVCHFFVAAVEDKQSVVRTNPYLLSVNCRIAHNLSAEIDSFRLADSIFAHVIFHEMSVLHADNEFVIQLGDGIHLDACQWSLVCILAYVDKAVVVLVVCKETVAP